MEKETVIWSETGTKNGVDYSLAQKFIEDDGGREAAGFKGKTGDCVTRAIAIATGKPYKEVYDALNEISKKSGNWNSYKLVKTNYGNSYKKTSSSRTGHLRKIYEKYLISLGWKWIPTMQIGQGCKVHLRNDELPKGTIIIKVSKHLTTMIDGVIHDTYDCSRQGDRCVYGYFIKNIEILK